MTETAMNAAQRLALPPRTARMLRELEGPRFAELARSSEIAARERENDVARHRASSGGSVRPLAHGLFALGAVVIVVVGALQSRAPGRNDDVRHVAGPAVPPRAGDAR
jgi:hypothetical protein